MLHNFFLESGARQQKLRVYETVSDPVSKALTGYLLVRGGVYQVAYAKALETLMGANITKMMPVPNIDTSKIPESKRLMEQGVHLKMYRFSPSDYTDMGGIWKGPHPDDGQEVCVTDELPNGGEAVDGGHESAAFAPEYEMEELMEIAKKLKVNI